jgi:hypothetical protein
VLTILLVRESIVLGAGWSAIGPDPGFFPLVMSMIIGISAVFVIATALRRRGEASSPFFERREEVVELLKVGLPLAAAIAAVQWLGFYIVVALYIGLFGLWYGRFRWYLILPGAVLLAVGLFLVLESGFRILMPKSVLYQDGTLPF